MLEFGMSCILVLVYLMTVMIIINLAKDVNEKIDELHKNANIKKNIILKRGLAKWIKVGNNKIKCSKCGNVFTIIAYPNVGIDFCPHCGTLMTKEDI